MKKKKKQSLKRQFRDSWMKKKKQLQGLKRKFRDSWSPSDQSLELWSRKSSYPLFGGLN